MTISKDCSFLPPCLLTRWRLLVLILGLLGLIANSMADDKVERYNSDGVLTASGSDLPSVQTFNGEFPAGSGNITAPADGDVIKVSEDISVSASISPDNNFTLQAKTNPVTISHSGSQTQLYNLSTVTNFSLKNVTISGFGKNNTSGGAIAIQNQNSGSSVNLTTDNVTFTGNTTGLNGGAIYISYPLTIAGETTFIGNTSENGGAIFVLKENSLTISGKTTFTGNSAEYGGAIYAHSDAYLIFEGDGSVGTFTNNVSMETAYVNEIGHDIRIYYGYLTFKDNGKYSFDGGITVPHGSTDIDKAQVTIAGRENCDTNRYQLWDVTISNGGKLIANLDYINNIESTPITFSDSASLVELTNALLNQTATIKSSTGDGSFLMEYLAAQGNVQKESLVISSGRIDAKGCMKAVIEVGSDATFSPGNSVGDLDLDGSKFTLDGEMLIEVNRTGADTLICGDFELGDGSVVIDWQNDEIPFFATCDLITSTSDLSDVYDNLIENLDLSGNPTVQQLYTDKYITLSLAGDNKIIRLSIDRNAVPEPSTWALLVLGAAGLLFWRKRK